MAHPQHEFVRARATSACEYCHMPQSLYATLFTTEHISATARRFRPRTDVWEDHFEWSAHIVVGRTPIGRTTVRVLAMNEPIIRAVRAALLTEGVFPPVLPKPPV
jgi:hypothetical protein